MPPNLKRKNNRPILCFVLFCDDFSDDSKKKSSTIIYYVLYCFVMILMTIQNISVQKNHFLRFILFFDELSDYSKK